MAFSLATPGTSRERAEHFLEHADKFKLGELLTEASHPKTRELSFWAKNDLPSALDRLRELDLSATRSLISKSPVLENLKEDIRQTIAEGKKVFLCGCGATGRLSLKLEFLWRQISSSDQKDQVIGFMAGGDVAFIRSIESFEDHFDFGERQLKELGYQDGDLVIGITEGGETSFVIGAVEAAASSQLISPYFLYCNPTDVLSLKVQRSKRVIENSGIKKVELAHEPMALSGSTRMQATTIQLLAMASCLFSQKQSVKDYIEQFCEFANSYDYLFLEPFIKKESEVYKSGGAVIYSTDEFGMTILTDTTERAPTFSLPPFENFDDPGYKPSLCYFNVQGTKSAEESWTTLLSRKPRTLEWEKYLSLAGWQRISGYDFSDQIFSKRELVGKQSVFKIYRESHGQVVWDFEGLSYRFAIGEQPLFFQHLLLKLFLNAHSTLIMGRLGRYQGNWMTWVKPSNGKLIDRAIRYIQGLCLERNVEVSYEKVALEVFNEMENLGDGEPIVMRVLEKLKLTS